MPFSANRLRTDLQIEALAWEDCNSQELLKSGHRIQSGGYLFSKIEDETIEAQKAKLEAAAAAKAEPKYEALKEEIQFEDFTKLDIRVGTILSAQKVKKADKLLHLEVDLGFEKRSIVSGIAQYFKPEDLPGTKVSVVVNLAPRKLRGVMSQGMILMAEDSEGNLKFTSAPADMPNGAVIR